VATYRFVPRPKVWPVDTFPTKSWHVVLGEPARSGSLHWAVNAIPASLAVISYSSDVTVSLFAKGFFTDSARVVFCVCVFVCSNPIAWLPHEKYLLM
jgi:hypothetical protein